MSSNQKPSKLSDCQNCYTLPRWNLENQKEIHMSMNRPANWRCWISPELKIISERSIICIASLSLHMRLAARVLRRCQTDKEFLLGISSKRVHTGIIVMTISSSTKLHKNRANWMLTMNPRGSRLPKTFTKSKTTILAAKTTKPIIELVSKFPSLRATPAAISAEMKKRTNI